jgi:hypothetical protein
MADAIRSVLSNLPPILFVVALVIPTLRRDRRPAARRFLDWQLLLPVGVGSLWAGLFHVFAPQIAAVSIGWAVSPFQFEIGVADIAIGLVAIASFWRSLSFQSAVVAYIVLFFAGVANGHVRQAVEAHDFATNNFGLLLIMTVVTIVLLPLLLWRSWKHERQSGLG